MTADEKSVTFRIKRVRPHKHLEERQIRGRIKRIDDRIRGLQAERAELAYELTQR